ncbi:hypothetical protein [Trebonia sp.]|uniref:hypothetical protein n=1 Tax=Trebonia sp. TaxID=2767075 RepID=UPI00262F4D2E|nr:hypothetical protein [Trebonia sp.]
MKRRDAQRIETRLKARYPGSEVTVDREPGGLRVQVRRPGSTIVAVTGDEPSAILAALTQSPEPEN